MKKFGILFIALIGFVVSANAQDSDFATSAATIITPISITKTANLNFGNVAVGATAGTAVLTTSGTVSGTAGVTIPTAGGSPTAAAFTINGETTNSFSIAFTNSSITLTKAGGGTMTVDNFVSSLGATSALVGGTKPLTVGATLNVAANQAAGLYENATDLIVVVNYN